jgi:hypothetical protein
MKSLFVVLVAISITQLARPEADSLIRRAAPFRLCLWTPAR